jgi:NADH:ubiquinone oxidoreductase subunit E
MSTNLIALQHRSLGEESLLGRLAELRAAQGAIRSEDIPRLAAELHLPAQLVRATAHFYDELKPAEPAAHRLQICDGEACRAAGADALAEEAGRLLAEPGGDRAGIRLERVSCLGYCSCAPTLMLDGRPLAATALGGATGAVQALTDPAATLPPGPRNPFHLPAAGAPCILLRRFGQGADRYDSARALGAYAALEQALAALTPGQVLTEIEQSRLRGRGGAGFPTGRKLRTVAEAPSPSGHRYVVANLDEGDAGAFIDKELAEQDPHALIEGVLLAAYVCGAKRAFIYVRHEYPRARQVLRTALEEARAAGWVGSQVKGSGLRCDIHLVEGQGAYICGEETSLLRSIEGLPAQVSARPPYPAESGLWGAPTAVNNVETLCNLPWIVQRGGAAYAALGSGESRGTKLVSLNSRVARRACTRSSWARRHCDRSSSTWPAAWRRGRSSRRCRWAAPWGQSCPRPCSIRRWIPNPSRPWGASSATAAWWSTARRKTCSPSCAACSLSAPRRAVASVFPAASGPSAGWN